MEDKAKLNELREAKCFIPDCEEKQSMYVECEGLLLPVCQKHFEKNMENATKWNRIAKKVEEALAQSRGEFVEIKTWEEFKERIKPEFLAVATRGLELTKGRCLECGKDAVGIIPVMKPVCEKHVGFPRMVDKVALKEEPLTYIG